VKNSRRRNGRRNPDALPGNIVRQHCPAIRKRHPLISLFMSLAMLSAIALSLAAGVGLGYVIIFGILYAFDRSRQPLHRAPAPVLNTSPGGN
jgi:hypothetical protein